ncbi:MAG TPA: PKD domain-containing protein, partial [Solirubrobacteraceae bacterium]|nr:PKD domain-containing protein [Solirubrobacteraceae bacterium]
MRCPPSRRVAALVLLVAAAVAPAAPASAEPGWLAAEERATTALAEHVGYVGAKAAMGEGGHALIGWSRSHGSEGGVCCRTSMELHEREPGGAWTGVEIPGLVARDEVVRDVAVGPTGAAAVFFTTDEPDDSTARLALRSADGDWSLAAMPPGATWIDHLSLDAAGRMTALSAFRCSGREEQCRDRLSASVWSPSSGWSAPKDLVVFPAAHHHIERVAAATGPDGELVVAFSIYTPTIKYSREGAFAAFVTTRPPSGTWTAPVQLTPWTDGAIGEVAVNGRGDAALTFSESEKGISMIRRPAGEAFGPAELIHPGRTVQRPDALTLDAAGYVTAIATHYVFDGPYSPFAEVVSGPVDGPLSGVVSVGDDASRLSDSKLVALRDGGALLIGAGDSADADSNSDHVRSFVRPSRGAAWTEVAHDIDLGDTHGLSGHVAAGDDAGNALLLWGRVEHVDGSTAANSMRSAAYDGAPPVIRDVSAPERGTAGSVLAFGASVVDVWSPVSTIAWDFGDGTTATGARVEHAYGAPGRYGVIVRATDARGMTAQRDPFDVAVAAAPAGGRADPPPVPGDPRRGGTEGSRNPPAARVGLERLRLRIGRSLVADRRGIVRLR